jgi:Type ISP C-terminal specificity domain
MDTLRVSSRREEKFVALAALSLDGKDWIDCPADWRAPFLPEFGGNWGDFLPLRDLFAYAGPGVMPGRTWAIAPDRESLRRRWSLLVAEKDLTRKEELFHPQKRNGKVASRHIDKTVEQQLGTVALLRRAFRGHGRWPAKMAAAPAGEREAIRSRRGAIPGAPEPLPETMAYDAAKRRLVIGKGFVENVTPAMRNYEVSGKTVLDQGFSYRRRDRTKPMIGDRRPPSPLEKIQPDGWLAEYTEDLLNLLNVLGRLVALEPRQADLLERIAAGSLVTVAAGGVQESGTTADDPSQ